jgi:hypothetical protein
MKAAIALFLALASLAIACLCASLPPVSECSAPNQVALLPALAGLCLFAAAGVYATLKGGAAERLILVAGSTLIMAAYFAILSVTLPIAIQSGIDCAGERAPVEQTGVGP